MNKPLVSVIIPIMNVEKYVENCIESVMSQTYENLEIFLMVGKCKDASLEKCVELQKKDDRIILVSRKDKGQGDARNYALDLIHGEFLAFIDADDWIAADYIEKLVSPLIESDADISVCDYVKVYEEEAENTLEQQFTGRKGFLDVDFKSYSVDASCVLYARIYRTSFYMLGQPRQYNTCSEDVAMHIIVASKVKKVHALHEPLYFYNQKNENATKRNVNNELQLFDALEYALQYFYKENLFDRFGESIKRYLWGTLTYHKNYVPYETMPESAKEPMYRFIKKYFPEYMVEDERRYTAFGSLNLNCIVHCTTSNVERLTHPYCSSSIISQFSHDEDTMSCTHSDQWQKQMLDQDIHKKLPRLLADTSQRIDFFFVDFMEERFDIIQTDSSYYTKSDAFDEAKREGMQEYKVIDSLSEEFMALWKEKCLCFIKALKARFQPEQIILVKTRLSEGFGRFGVEEFYDAVKKIRQNNLKICEMEKFFIDHFEGIHVFDLPENLIFTDKDSKFGISPAFLNLAVYESMGTNIFCKVMLKSCGI